METVFVFDIFCCIETVVKTLRKIIINNMKAVAGQW